MHVFEAIDQAISNQSNEKQTAQKITTKLDKTNKKDKVIYFGHLASKCISEEPKALFRTSLNSWTVHVPTSWLFPKAFQSLTGDATSSLKTRAHNRPKRHFQVVSRQTKPLKTNHSGNNPLKALKIQIFLVEVVSNKDEQNLLKSTESSSAKALAAL